MCTTISETRDICGAGKGSAGWFAVNQSTVAFDHATHTGAEHALLLDFANYDLGPGARWRSRWTSPRVEPCSSS